MYTSDVSGFDAFYESSSRAVFKQVFALTSSQEEALDCLQEAYAKAWQNWDRIAGYEDPASWVRTVARRIAVGRWRRSKRSLRTLLSRTGTAADDRIEQYGDLVALVSALKRLPRVQQQAIVLHHVADLSVDQVASELGVPIGTIKARLSRGRIALAGFLSEGEGVRR